MREPHAIDRDLVDGDFYVDHESCMLCDAPPSEAPDLIVMGENGCCFVKQPITPEEVERACRAVLVSCVEAVRYRGRDRNILRRLYDLGTYASCDAVPTELENRVSDHVQKVFPDLTTGWVKRVQEIFPDLTSKPVHWTFVCEDNSQAAVIACCYGPNPSTLAICEVAKASGEVTLILDDAKYRPQHADIFKSPKPTHR